MSHRWLFALLLALLPARPAGAALPSADELCDLTPPAGVDAADVERLLQLVSGESIPGPEDGVRGDVAPGALLSQPADPVPHRVRPNPAPTGMLDIGDAVLAARRAAGEIVFDGLNLPPTISLLGDGGLTNLPSGWTLAGTVTDDQQPGLCTVELWLNGAPAGSGLPVAAGGLFEALLAGLVEGPNRIEARATDGFGRIGPLSDTITVILDTVPPLLVVESPEPFAYIGLAANPFRFSGTASDALGISVVLVDGQSAMLIEPADPGSPWLWGRDVPFVTEGPRTVLVQARDRAGNPSDPAAVLVHYDATPPELYIDPPDSLTNLENVTLTGTADDGTGIAGVQVDGAPALFDSETGSWRIEVAVAEGGNEYSASATDLAGNPATAGPVTIVGDFTPPLLWQESDRFVAVAAYTWEIGISEPVTVLTIDGLPHGTRYTGQSFSLPPRTLVPGLNRLTVAAEDDAGNRLEFVFEAVLDTAGPQIRITEVSNAGFRFQPEGGVDGVVTNAPTVTIRGAVSDPLSGVGWVTVNGYPAAVTDGLFSLSGLPLIPRANPFAAEAADNAGNRSTHAITVHRDVEGPALTLSGFSRAAYLSPAGQFDDPGRGLYDGSGGLAIGVTATDGYTGVAGLAARWSGQSLTVQPTAVPGGFTVALPAALLAGPGLGLLELSASDGFDNVNTDILSGLSGSFAPRASTVKNGAGLALSADSLSAFTGMIEGELEAMDGSTMIDAPFSQAGLSGRVTGLAFCDPAAAGRSRYAGPSGTMNPPVCRYGCSQDVLVLMGINASGQVTITMTIPYLHVDMEINSGIWCWGGSQGYAKAQPAVISLTANFVDGPQGPALEAVPGSVNVTLNSFGISLQNCGFADWLIGLLEGTIRESMESEFEGQIGSILGGLGDALAQPLLQNENTAFSLYIAQIRNSVDGLRFWLDFHGSPCPDASHLTDKSDDTTEDPADFKPCPSGPGSEDVYRAPGSYLTPNPDAASRPALALVDPAGNPRSLRAAINDDLANYLLFSEWAQGTLDMRIDQATIGDTLALDTLGFSIFVPELNNPARTDVQAIVPSGTPLVIDLHPMLPITIEGIDNAGSDPDGVRLRAGDLILSVKADTAGDSGFATPLFDIAVSLFAPVGLSLQPAVEAWQADALALQIGDPVVHVDLAWSAFVLNEDTLRDNIPNLVGLVLPMFTADLGRIELPGSALRVASVSLTDPNAEFIDLSGDLQAAIAVVDPHGEMTGDLPLRGRVNDLRLGANQRIDVRLDIWLGPAGGTPELLSTTESTAQSPTGILDFSGTIPAARLAAGGNRLFIAAEDRNHTDAFGLPHLAYLTVTIEYDPATGVSQVTAGASDSLDTDILDALSGSGGCLGCASQDPGPVLLWLAGFLGLWAVLRRRRRPAAARSGLPLLLVVLLLAAGAACSNNVAFGDGDTDGDGQPDGDPADGDGEADGDADVQPDGDEPPPVFTGPDIDDDPVVVLNLIAIGGETDGFNLDEGRSPEGDPDPDNGLASLGDLANEPLAEAVGGGSVILLLRFSGLDRLPAAGESGRVRIEGYLGLDQDGNPADNFSGSETFAIDPASYDDLGRLLIDFPGVTIEADGSGQVRMMGGPAVFSLSIPLDDSGNAISLSITETQIASLLAPSLLRSAGLDLSGGLLGGVIPCAVLGEPLEALGDIAPLQLLKKKVDIDLNGDGRLDRTYDPTNPTGNKDGISAAVLVGGVPAFIDQSTANRAPVVELDPLPAEVGDPELDVSGSFDDPDGACTRGTVEVRAGETVFPAAVVAGESGCTFTASIVLGLGENRVTATATDERGATAADSASVTLVDSRPPVVELTGPPAGEVTTWTVRVTGTATDNVGVVGVELRVEGGGTWAIPGEQLGPGGGFELDVTLARPGDNTLTAVALDLADNQSQPATLALTLVDRTPPQPVLTSVGDGSTTVSPPDPLQVHAPAVTIAGSVSDDFGPDGLSVFATVGAGTPVEAAYDPLTGGFTVALTVAPGDNALLLTARDLAGNEGTAAHDILFSDIRPPQIRPPHAPVPPVTAAAQTLRFRIEDDVDPPAALAPTVSHNGGVPAAAAWDQTAGDFRLPMILVYGDNRVRIAVADTAGNPASWEGVIRLDDIAPPLLALTAPADGTETFEASIEVAGTATDDIGLADPAVTVVIGSDSWMPPVGPDGAFAQTVPLALGPNTIEVEAADLAGQTAGVTRTVVRRDPDAPEAIGLTIEPPTILIGTGRALLTARVERAAGGPAPAGTLVRFAMDPEGIGLLEATEAAIPDGGGAVTVGFLAGPLPGRTVITASAGDVSDSGSLVVATPSLCVATVCSDGTSPFAGLATTLDHTGPAVLGPPGGGLETTPVTGQFHTRAAQRWPSTLLWAGTRLAGAGEIGRVGLPIESGLPEAGDFRLGPATVADLLGATGSGAGFAVCSADNRLGDLPPVVRLDRPPASVTTAAWTLTGTVDDAELADCTGQLSHNGRSEPVDVSSGAVALPVTLDPGANTLTLTVTDPNGNQGFDAVSVRYQPPNDPPQLAVTFPGSTTAEASVVVRGTLADDGPLDSIAVRVRTGVQAEWTPCSVDAAAGTWRSDAALPLALGANVIRVEAQDGGSATTAIVHNVRRVEPVNPPVITISEPAEGADFVQNPVAVRGRIDEGGNPAQIAVSLTQNGTPRPVSWDYFNRTFEASLVLTDGQNAIIVRAEEPTGGSDEERRNVTFTAPDNAPTVRIASPADGVRLAESVVLVEGTISDDRALDTLRSFAVNGVPAVLATPGGVSSAWHAVVPLSAGSNLLLAEAVDTRGNRATAQVTVDNVTPPAIVLNMIRIGSAVEGFNVDQVGPLGDIGPDNALSGLGALANPILADQLVDPEKPLLLILELAGLAELPGPGDPAVTVTINGYIGLDLDLDGSDNFSGQETFGIDPSSFGDDGLPVIRFPGVQVKNEFGRVRIDTFPSNPAVFEIEIASGETPLLIRVDPAYLDAVLTETADGVALQESLLGGVVPAGLLAMELEVEGQTINPLELLIRNDPADPVPDVDLNGDGVLATNPETDATVLNPDGISVGIKLTGVPCRLER